MDIRDLGKSGNVERSNARPARPPAAREYVIPSLARDEARISSGSRDAAAALSGLAARARSDEPGRDALVAAALQRLQRGELADQSVLSATAQRLLDSGYSSI